MKRKGMKRKKEHQEGKEKTIIRRGKYERTNNEQERQETAKTRPDRPNDSKK